ncbi:MAG: hypothetical protein KJZ84_06880 [Bryobacteraceae bacterium]|nr:hypothetical protein [Bryobacteraceae bacterium]
MFIFAAMLHIAPPAGHRSNGEPSNWPRSPLPCVQNLPVRTAMPAEMLRESQDIVIPSNWVNRSGSIHRSLDGRQFRRGQMPATMAVPKTDLEISKMALTNTIPVILESLQKRRAAIDQVIAALQALADTEGPRRGRRPKALAGLGAGAPAKPRRRMSEETRRKMSEAARKRAERRRAEQGKA